MKPTFLSLILLILFSAQAAEALAPGAKATDRPEPVDELEPGFLRGYLDIARVEFGRGIALAEHLPNSALLVPPPPDESSARFEYDQERIQAAVASQDSDRMALALRDDTLLFPDAARTFECSLGIAISQDLTPFLFQILRRTVADAALSTFPAKYKFSRQRPFQVNGGQTGLSEEQLARLTPAYPSAHAAIGWVWALILSGIAPEHSNAILARGLSFGQSRAVLNLHWQSDIEWGQLLGSTVVAQLHANETFRRDFLQAKREYQLMREQNMTPTINCDEETRAMM